MDIKRLSEIEERCEKATPGPWRFPEDENVHDMADCLYRVFDRPPSQEDYDFVLSARTDVPDLVAAYKLLRAEAAELARKLNFMLLNAGAEFSGEELECYCGEAMDDDGNLDEEAKCTVCQSRELLSRPSIVDLLKKEGQ